MASHLNTPRRIEREWGKLSPGRAHWSLLLDKIYKNEIVAKAKVRKGKNVLIKAGRKRNTKDSVATRGHPHNRK